MTALYGDLDHGQEWTSVYLVMQRGGIEYAKITGSLDDAIVWAEDDYDHDSGNQLLWKRDRTYQDSAQPEWFRLMGVRRLDQTTAMYTITRARVRIR